MFPSLRYLCYWSVYFWMNLQVQPWLIVFKEERRSAKNKIFDLIIRICLLNASQLKTHRTTQIIRSFSVKFCSSVDQITWEQSPWLAEVFFCQKYMHSSWTVTVLSVLFTKYPMKCLSAQRSCKPTGDVCTWPSHTQHSCGPEETTPAPGAGREKKNNHSFP